MWTEKYRPGKLDYVVGHEKMREVDVEIGMKVSIVDIKPAFGYMVSAKHLKARRMGDTGIVRGMVQGHGGEVFAVQHNDGSIAVYRHDEFVRDEEMEQAVITKGS